MEQINQKWDRILEQIYENSIKRFTVRELSKRAGVPTSSVQRYLAILRKEKIIDNENKAIHSSYFRFKKSSYIVDKMYKSGLIDHLNLELNPSLIILFGSIRKGEYDSESDIDIFIETSIKKELNLKKFEAILKHNIQLFRETNIKNLQINLFNNVVNGIKLFGYLKIK